MVEVFLPADVCLFRHFFRVPYHSSSSWIISEKDYSALGCDGVTVGADAGIRNPPLFIIENVIISSHIVYCSEGSDVDLRSGAINRIIGIPEDG